MALTFQITTLLALHLMFAVVRMCLLTSLPLNLLNVSGLRLSSELESYRNLISASLPTLPVEVVSCCAVNCTIHLPALDHYCEKLFTCLLQSARASIPHYDGQPFHLAGFNDAARNHKTKANFWHRVWSEAGYPSVGILFQIKHKSKARFKYEVRRLKRRKLFLRCQKMADALASSSRDFWGEVKRINRQPSGHGLVPTLECISGHDNIANLWSDNYNLY